MKSVIFVVLFMLSSALFGMDLFSNGRYSTLLQGSPQEQWLIVQTSATGYVIYNESFQNIGNFSLPAVTAPYANYITGVGRDFDGDANIEILYYTYSDSRYKCYLRDISSSVNEMVWDTQGYNYTAYSGYLGNERIAIISDYNNNICKVYRSNIQTPIEDNTAPIKPQSGMNAYPNPLYGYEAPMTIAFETGNSEKVSVSVYNIKGQKVKELCHEQAFPDGKNQLIWDGKDLDGCRLPSGVYLIQKESHGKSEIIKQMIIK